MKIPVVLVLNKIDLVAKARLLPLMEQAQQLARRSRRSCRCPPQPATASSELERVLLEQLPEGEPIYPEDYLTDQPERTLVAEIVREKVLPHTRDELPFSTAVVVDQFDETERERHAAAVLHDLGRDASRRSRSSSAAAATMIKRIGTEARHELEAFFKTKVYLDLRVKVDPDWRNNDRTLDEARRPEGEPRRRRDLTPSGHTVRARAHRTSAHRTRGQRALRVGASRRAWRTGAAAHRGSRRPAFAS